ncbi:MAG: hypothetical protein ACQKBT_04520 [Puniceicoccales bacterium]
MTASRRIVVTGCWGAGKTYLARKLKGDGEIPLLSLDHIVFERVLADGSGEAKTKVILRKREEVQRLLGEFLLGYQWILEGVYGKYLSPALQTATLFVWIDRPEEDCLAGLKERGIQMMKDHGRDLSEEQNARMFERVRNYRERDDHLGFRFHRKLFDSFRGEKVRITSKKEADQWLASLLC